MGEDILEVEKLYDRMPLGREKGMVFMSVSIQNRIRECFIYKGYQELHFNLPNLILYQRESQDQIYAVLALHVENYEPGSYMRFGGIFNQVYAKIMESASKPVKMMALVECENMGIAREYAGLGMPIWLHVDEVGQLVIYENEPQDFDQMRNALELIYDQSVGVRQLMKKSKALSDVYVPMVTLVIILCNMIVHFGGLLLFSGKFRNPMLYYGALSWMRVEKGEVYRLLTSIFLHGDISHLLNNMIVLLVVGGQTERLLGRVRFLILYFGAGILAGVFSLGYNRFNGEIVTSIGASGAIMGVVGAFAYILIRNKGRIADMSLRRIIMFVFFSIYGGITSEGIDNMAHIGGIISGFIICMLLYRVKKHPDKKVDV